MIQRVEEIAGALGEVVGVDVMASDGIIARARVIDDYVSVGRVAIAKHTPEQRAK